jgi:CrcB protein
LRTENDEYTSHDARGMADFGRTSSLALIGAGGFIGAASRHVVAVALPTAFPVGTLVANVCGAFLLGLVLYDQHLADRLGPETRLLVGTGFCSSFTTYSTFATETSTLAPELAAVNVLANYALGFLAIVVARVVTRWAA